MNESKLWKQTEDDFERTALIKSARNSTKAPTRINGKFSAPNKRKSTPMLVIGKRDMEADAVSVRIHSKGNLGAWPRAEVIADLLRTVAARSA